jgi:elongation factor P
MLTANLIRNGMAIRFEGQPYKVISAEYHPGQGKMGGVTHARLRNLNTGTTWEHSFRADLKVEEISLSRKNLEFLYADGPLLVFMDPETGDQAEVDAALAGPQGRFLIAGMQLCLEFAEDRPVFLLFPDFMEVVIADTAPPVHGQGDNTWKPAKLENGVEVMVPQFIKTGDAIRYDLNTQKYMDRVKA